MGNFIGGVAKFVWGLLVLTAVGIKITWLIVCGGDKPKYEYKPLPTIKAVEPYKNYDVLKPRPTTTFLSGIEPKPLKYSFEDPLWELKKEHAVDQAKATKSTAPRE